MHIIYTQAYRLCRQKVGFSARFESGNSFRILLLLGDQIAPESRGSVEKKGARHGLECTDEIHNTPVPAMNGDV